MADTPSGGGTPIGGVTVEITAPIDRLNADFAAAESRTRQADAALSAAMGQTKDATVALAKAQLELVAAVNAGGTATAAQIRAVGGYAAAQAILANSTKATAEAQAVLAAAQATGARTAAEETAATIANTVAKDADTAATVANTAAHVSNRAAYESLVLVHEALQGRFTRMAGSAMILGQAMLGAEGTAGLLGAIMSPLGLAIIGTAGAMVVATKATLDYDAALQHARETAVGMGAASRVSSKDLEALAETSGGGPAFTGNVTEGAVRSLDAALAHAGADAITMQALNDQFHTFTALTGEKVPEAVKQLASAMDDPIAGVKELQKQFNFLDPVEEQAIIRQAELGDKVGAGNRLMVDFAAYLNQADKAAGGTTTTINDLASGFSHAWTQLGKLIDNMDSFINHTGPFKDAARRAQQAAEDQAQATAQANRDIQAGYDASANIPAVQEGQRFTQLTGERNQVRTALEAARRTGNAQAVADLTGRYNTLNDAIGRVTDTQGRYIDQASRTHQIAQLEEQAAQASNRHNTALQAKLKTQIALLKTGDELISNTQAQQAAADQGALAGARAERTPHAQRVDEIAAETAKLKANTDALLGEAAAYLKADAAQAMSIEARRQAADFAASHPKANVDAMTALYLGQDVAKAADEGAKRVESTTAQTEALRRLNDQVAAGTLTAAEANREAKQEELLRPLLAAEANAEGKAKAQLTQIIEALTAAEKASNAELERQEVLSATEAGRQRLADLQTETAELGKTNRERDVAIAQERALQFLREHNTSPTSPEGQAYVSTQVAGANAKADEANAAFVQKQTEAITAQIKALGDEAATFGMTTRQAAEYVETQKLLAQATAQGLDLTAQQIDRLRQLGKAYGDASDDAKKLKDAESAAKKETDDLASAITDVLTGAKTGKQALHDFVHQLDTDVIKGALSGQGPLGAILGGKDGKGALGGIQNGLTSIFSKVLGVPVGSTGGKADGSAAAPFFVRMADAAGLGGLFGNQGTQAGSPLTNTGDAVSEIIAGATKRESPLVPAAGGAGGLLGGIGHAASGLLGGLGSIFGGASSGGGGGGLLGGLLGLFGGGSPIASGSKPDGTQANPFWTQSASSGGGIGGIFSSLLGGGGGDAAGGIASLAGLFHGGGTVGTSLVNTRIVSPSMFVSAPRLHSGLAADEYPAILQRGEQVTPRGGRRRGGDFHMHVHGAGDPGAFNRSSRQIERQLKRQMDRA